MSGLFMSIDSFSFLNLIFFSFLFIILFIFLTKKNFFFILNLMKNLENSFPEEKFLNQKKIIIFIFLMIFIFNFLSLFSHIFSLMSMISITLIISITFWTSMFIMNIIYFLKEMLIHLTPISTPLVLMSFMVLIESVSQLIRPITLMVRLATNLTTGHLILGLMSFKSMISFLSQLPFFLLEMMVALVQAYVFSLLVMLYFNE